MPTKHKEMGHYVHMPDRDPLCPEPPSLQPRLWKSRAMSIEETAEFLQKDVDEHNPPGWFVLRCEPDGPPATEAWKVHLEDLRRRSITSFSHRKTSKERSIDSSSDSMDGGEEISVQVDVHHLGRNNNDYVED